MRQLTVSTNEAFLTSTPSETVTVMTVFRRR